MSDVPRKPALPVYDWDDRKGVSAFAWIVKVAQRAREANRSALADHRTMRLIMAMRGIEKT